MSTDPTAEHIDAVARVIDPGAWSDVIASIIGPSDVAQCRDYAKAMAGKVLTSTDPAVHAALAASLPAEVMLAALVDRGALTVHYGYRDHGGDGIWQPGLDLTTTRLHAAGLTVVARHFGQWREVAP